METTQQNEQNSSTTANEQLLYRDEILKYSNPEAVEAMKVDNPLYDSVFEQNEQADKEERNKWERVAAFSGLNNIFQNVGSMISASAGVKPVATDNTIQNLAQNKLDKIEERSRQNYETYYKYKLNQANTDNQAIDKSNKDYLDRIKSLNDQEQESELLAMRLSDNAASRQAREDLENQQMQNSVDLAKLKAVLSSSKTSERTPKLYVINSEGVRVPIMEEEATKLYQIAKLRNLDADYNNAVSENARKNEYNVMMQRAYLEYEKQK
ncbi:MAG: hypothetical protein R3Y50_01095 [Rikenellaceae bacterium]